MIVRIDDPAGPFVTLTSHSPGAMFAPLRPNERLYEVVGFDGDDNLILKRVMP